MGILYVTEFSTLGTTPWNQTVQQALQPPAAEQAITYSTSTQSAAFKNNTNFVRLNTDSICSIAFGINPTAVASTNARMSAGSTEYFAVPVGQAFKVAAVTTPV